MKKRVCLVTSLTLFLLTSCNAPGSETVQVKDIFSEPFTSTATIVTDDLEATGQLSRYGMENWDIEFSEPSSLSGVTLIFDGTNSEASYKGLSFSMPKSAVPVNSMLLCLATAVDEISASTEKNCTSNDGVLTFKGSTDCGDYILTVDEGTGNLTEFQMKNLNLVMTFTDVQTLDTSIVEDTSPATEEGTTIDTDTSDT